MSQSSPFYQRKVATPSRLVMACCVVGFITTLSGCATTSEPAEQATPAATVATSTPVQANQTSRSSAAATSLTPTTLRVQLAQANTALRDNDCKSADALFTSVIAAEQFTQLTAEEQFKALYLGGLCAAKLGDAPRALTSIKRATGMPQAGATEWRARFELALISRDFGDALVSLTTIVPRWPAQLAKIDESVIDQLLASTSRQAEYSEPRYHLLEALYNAKWRTQNGEQPENLWLDYALQLLDRDETTRAAEVISQIASAPYLVRMKVDKRFDAAIAATTQRLDVERAAAQDVMQRRRYMSEHPRSLAAVLNLTTALIINRQFKEALSAADSALAAVKYDPTTYNDTEQYLPWIMSNRARALTRLNRWKEALETMNKAAEIKQDAANNVSHVINLAALQLSMKQPHDALETLQRVGDKRSPYADMVLTAAQHTAALQTGDATELQRTTAYLREHQTDSMKVFRDSLVEDRQLDEAAAILIKQLDDPRQRNQTLAEIQDFTTSARSPYAQELYARWQTLLTRPDVQKAVKQVGRIQHFNIDAPPGF